MTPHKNQVLTPPESTHITSTTMPTTFVEVSTSSFNHNAAYYKNRIGRQNNLAVVIKGNGYGHGLQHIALLCQQNNLVDWICVAQLSEALALQNISKPILVLGYSDVSPEYAVNKNIHLMVDHLEYAHTLNNIGKKHSYQFNVHVKVDTGLSRMGVLVSEAHTFIQELQRLDYIHIAGIYSHFSASDTNPEFTAHQLEEYNNILAQLQQNNSLPTHIHMSNTASISTVQYPQHFNFFRIGLGVYGLGQDKAHLKPVMTWKTYISNIKTVPAGSRISYTGSFITQRITRIALLPIGYYDGYDFRFSNKTSVMINGSYAPIIGRVAMNMTIVDVTDIETITGDEVTLLGAAAHINAHNLAQSAEIKNVREIITGINPNITRILTL
ncbi:MAG TPA: alanine racemase [Candidatus Babeliales bacterium]|nr:alanine racemase [Candidatus Babeliales bacterium]